LINAVERGVIPHTVAMQIARAKDGEVQQELAQAYEEKNPSWQSGVGDQADYRPARREW